MKKIPPTGVMLGVLAVVLALLVLSGLPGPKAASQAAATPTSKASVFTETFGDQSLSQWQAYQNWHGEVIAVPAENAVVGDGTLDLGISPDPEFDPEEGEYNNVFLLSTTPLTAPTATTKMVAEFLVTGSKGYEGSFGFWIQKRGTFTIGINV